MVWLGNKPFNTFEYLLRVSAHNIYIHLYICMPIPSSLGYCPVESGWALVRGIGIVQSRYICSYRAANVNTYCTYVLVSCALELIDTEIEFV